MKFRLPELVVLEDEGFDSKKDIFQRKTFGENLANIFSNTEEELVIALNGGWGEGKSTFVHMWRGHVENREQSNLHTIYFDAFKNDFQKDAFLAIASEIHARIPTQKKELFKKSILKAGKAIARGGLKLGVRVGTAGILSGEEVDFASKEAAKIFSNQVESLIEERLNSASDDQACVEEFNNILRKLFPKTDSSSPKTVFIIDELDRCKPDFSLEMLEVVKHFFSVPGLSFLLVVNRSQLEAAIRGRYGVDVEAEQYLNKFVHLFAQIPNSKPGLNTERSSKIFFRHCVKEMTNGYSTVNLNMLFDLVSFFDPSFREIERLIASYNIACASELVSFDGGGLNYQAALVTFVVWESVMNPKNMSKIQSNEANGAEIVKKSGLTRFINTSRYGECNVPEMLELVMFDKGSDEERQKMIEAEGSAVNAYLNPQRSRDEWRNYIVSISSTMANISSS